MTEIIYKCPEYVITKKPAGISSQKNPSGDNMIVSLSEILSMKEESIFPIHRLDTPVGGTMIYALDKKSASLLSEMVAKRTLKKYYLAVIHGKPEELNGKMQDLLFRDSRTNKSYVVKRMRKGVKEALLEYQVLDTKYIDNLPVSLIRILLHTGRTHQIRIQFSHRKMPLLGDRRYGSGKDSCSVALWSDTLEFVSPFDGKEKRYESKPDTTAFPWLLFDKEKFDI